jgi:hypothetical protein
MQYTDFAMFGALSQLGSSNNPYLPKVIAKSVVSKFYASAASGSSHSHPSEVTFFFSGYGPFRRRAEAENPADLRSSSLVEKIDNLPVDCFSILRDLEEVYYLCIRWLRTNNPEVYKTLNVYSSEKDDPNYKYYKDGHLG